MVAGRNDLSRSVSVAARSAPLRPGSHLSPAAGASKMCGGAGGGGSSVNAAVAACEGRAIDGHTRVLLPPSNALPSSLAAAAQHSSPCAVATKTGHVAVGGGSACVGNDEEEGVRAMRARCSSNGGRGGAAAACVAVETSPTRGSMAQPPKPSRCDGGPCFYGVVRGRVL